MELKALQERREMVTRERARIEEKIKTCQEISQKANQQMQELVGLLNINTGVISEIDFFIAGLTEKKPEPETKEAPDGMQ
jgi:DNA-binding transcriptional MerR regulator